MAGHVVQGVRVTDLVFTSQRLDHTWAAMGGFVWEAWTLQPTLLWPW